MMCGGDCPRCFDLTKPQPHGAEIRAGGLFIKEMRIDKAGTPVFQHAHVFDHVSYLATGSVRVWIEGKLDRDYVAPAAIFIAARVKHEFKSLVDDTLVLCIHNIGAAERVAIHEEHPVMEAV
jgi:quercetin dioxygenase-like cupin family protein